MKIKRVPVLLTSVIVLFCVLFSLLYLQIHRERTRQHCLEKNTPSERVPSNCEIAYRDQHVCPSEQCFLLSCNGDGCISKCMQMDPAWKNPYTMQVSVLDSETKKPIVGAEVEATELSACATFAAGDLCLQTVCIPEYPEHISGKTGPDGSVSFRVPALGFGAWPTEARVFYDIHEEKTDLLHHIYTKVIYRYKTPQRVY